ncbi:UDP-N-acetylmuramate--L-alanine ligase [Glycomyces sp. TRM65418]|uniref:UDP-N-acetylmuramate--L-alanine ligase n=1 Tax=Glycomyces sp. TRM65418 TaxID=2867006 RepID=UPI001D16F0F2|nr:UDP-N-acetylmuramate--L-alanine ligase [Glycomyces sp. TRM65418]MCC3762075.1 UDP-N-acetylmuramate--L-alanine ligase [Glycomyces sp. TRM65418]
MTDPNDLSSPIDEGITAEDLGRTLFIGVGGVGMNGLTRLYATRGLDVTGSETKDWPTLPELERLGVTLHREHAESNLDGIDTVVRSTAINDRHLEVVEARKRGIRVYHRSEALAAAMTGRRSIVVTGTHGKTTTTAIVTQMLEHAGLEPSYVNGGEIIGAHSGAHGAGDLFVAEADESDRSFLRYRPEIGIVTNIDVDHLNNYGDMDALTEAFERFCRNTDKDGLLVLCADNHGTAGLAAKLRAEGRTVATYGFADGADVQLGEVESHKDGVDYTVLAHNQLIGRFHLPMPGRHIALNSAAAIAVGLYVGLEPEALIEGIASFGGVKRRFEKRGETNGYAVFDEYAYHPTAMTEAIKTLREVAAPGRLVVVFQPYRVYRTVEMRDDIAEALALADKVVVMEIFGPGETIPEGEGGAALHEAIALPEADKVFVPEWNDVPAAVRALAAEGDVVVTMGAPPVSLMPDDLLR